MTQTTRECGSDEVRLKIAYCGICGTDVNDTLASLDEYVADDRQIHEYLAGPVLLPKSHERNKYSGAGLPQIIGHEFSGTIVELGKDVNNVEMQDKVVVNPAIDDQQRGYEPCEFCLSGRRNICARSTFYGLNDKGGGFADEIVVKASSLVPLPRSVSLKVAALAEPLAVAAHMIRIAGFHTGDNVVVLGAGPIGCALTFLLKDASAGQVIVSEVASSRAVQAESCGADAVINPTEQDVLRVVRTDMGEGADITFDACGLQTTLDTAIAATKPGGTIFNVAIHEKPVSIDMNLLTIKEKRLLQGNAYTAQDFDQAVQIIVRRPLDVERFITAIVPLENAVEDGFIEIVENKAKHNKILIKMAGDG